MPGTTLQISIEARDNASAALDSVRNKLQLFDQYGHTVSDLTTKTDGFTKATDAHSLSMMHSTRAVRELTEPLLYGLSPALGQTSSQFLLAVRGATMLSSGFTALGLVAAATGGILGGQLLEHMRKLEQQATDLRKAETGLDFQTLVSGATAARKSVMDLGDELDHLVKVQKDLIANSENRGAGFGLDLVLGFDPKTSGPVPAERERQLKLWVAQGQRTLATQRGREASGFAEAENVVPPAQDFATTTMSLEANRRIADIQKQVTEVGILDPIERTFQAAIREANSALLAAPGAEGATVRDAAIRLATTQRAEALRLRSAGTLGRDLVEPGQGFESAIAGANDEVTRMGIDAKRWAEGLKLLRESLERDVTGGQMETALSGLQPGEESKFRAEALQRRTEELGIFQQMAALQVESAGLSRDQSRAIEEEVIARQHALELEKAGNDLDKQNLANLRAAAAITKLNERDQAGAGLMRGLADMETEFGSVGLRMQSLARGVADGMANSFSDGFFDVLTGNFKSLPDVARSFTNSMVRAVTDELAKLVTAPILGTLKGVLGDLFGGGGSGTSPFGNAGARSLAEAPASATNIFVTTTGRPLSESEIQTAYAAGGEQGVLALRRDQAAVSGGEFVPTDGGGGEIAGISQQMLSSGPGYFSRALPVAGSAAALGLTALSARGNTSDLGTGVSAGLGGLTGATLGASLANLFPSLGVSSGWGAAGGAIAGAAIAGTIAALSKAEADKQAAKARQTAEITRAAGAGSDLVSSAGSATSVADLYRRIAAFGSGYSGGTANPAVPVTVDTASGPKAIGEPNAVFPTATLADLIANPGSLKANIQAGVDPSTLVGPNATTSKALSDMATDLVNQFHQTEQGVGITQTDLMPGGLTRRTTVPASRADQINQLGGAVEIDQLALNALSDDDRAALLLDVLGRVAAEQDIESSISDPATGQIVSITRIARSTIGLPGATTPVPAPVTTGAPGSTPTTSTADLLTAGGALALGTALSLADPNSLLNSILPSGFTGPDLARALVALFSPDAGVGTSLTWANGATSNISSDTLRSLQGALENSGQEAFSGLTSAGADASIPGAGILDIAGGLAGIAGLIQGAQAGDPVSIISGIANIYGALSSIAPATFTPIATVLGNAFVAIAPEAAAALTGTAVGVTTGAEVAATAITAAAPWIALAAPVLFWAAMKLTEPGPSDAWAIVGGTATALQTAARTSIAQANSVFAALRAQRITDPAAIQQAISLGAAALYNYYRVVQNPRGATISVATFYAYTKQDPTPLQNAAALLQQNMKDAVAELSRQGIAPSTLGNLAPKQVGDLLAQGGQPYSAALQAAPKIVPGGQPIMNEVQVGEGSMLVDTGQVTQPTDQTQNVNQGIQANLATGRRLPTDTVNAEYGGPLWTLFRYLAGPSATGYDVTTPTITGAQPWLAGGAAPGTVAGPTAQEAALSDQEIKQLLAVAALLQAAFTSGGGDAGATGLGPPGLGEGTAGSAAAGPGPAGPW